MTYENISIDYVEQHNHWSGKNCPRFLRSGEKGINWNGFIKPVREEFEVTNNKPRYPEIWEVQTKNGYFDGTRPLDERNSNRDKSCC